MQFLGADAAVGGASALHLYIGISTRCGFWCAAPPAKRAVARTEPGAVPGAFGGAPSVRNFWVHKKSPVPKNRGSVVRPKGFEPPTF